ncbi:MAG TPA: DUF2339 domain-containing protein [Cellvibrionaceae bacterium]
MAFFILILFGCLAYFLTRLSKLETKVQVLEKRLLAKQKEAAPSQAASQPVPEPASVPASSTLSSAFKTAPPPKAAPEPKVVTRPQVVKNPMAARSTAQVQRFELELTEPTAFEKAVDWIKRYFTEGNIIVRVGVVVLFFGVAFLLQYANQQGVLPVELKMSAVGLLGSVLLGIGWRLRHSRRGYGLILQGGGVGILYITFFAALRLFDLIPAELSFALLLVMVVLCAVLALLQDAKSLAVMAVTGGFLAPLLTATDSGSHIVLFSYYLLLNAGIVGIAWFKAWRSLNVLGFVFTFVIASIWGGLEYSTEYWYSTQIFLALFFLFYVLIAVLFAVRQPPELKGYVDGTLVFGVPLVGFALQASLVYGYEYGLAWSALVLGCFYGLIAYFSRLQRPSLLLLSEAFIALAVIFLTLAIPLALSGQWVATAWALEGAAILWISLRQRRFLAASFALALQLLAGLLYVPELAERTQGWWMFNAGFLGGLMLVAGGVITSYLLRQASNPIAERLRIYALPFLLWALLWWFVNGLVEILIKVDTAHIFLTLSLFIAVSCVALAWVEHVLGWSELRHMSLSLLIFIGVTAVISALLLQEPLGDFIVLAWLALFAAFYGVLYWRDHSQMQPVPLLHGLHAAGYWVLALVATFELYWLASITYSLAGDWLRVMQVPVLLALLWAALKLPLWPWQPYRNSYLLAACTPLAAVLVLWLLVQGVPSTASFSGLTYMPLLNPLDLLHILLFFTLFIWGRSTLALPDITVTRRDGLQLLAGLVFIWANTVLLRSLYHYADVAYTPTAILLSPLAQAALSVFWTIIGLVVMFIATRKGWRTIWLAAAGLLAVVVIKLFLLDMQDSNTLEAIVSFIAVGLLLLAVGYISPLPPKKISVQD